MKKSYIRFFLIMAVLIAVGLMLSGKEVRAFEMLDNGDNWRAYDDNGDKYVTVYLDFGSSDMSNWIIDGELKIPDNIKGYPVKKVDIFFGNSQCGVTSIYFPNGVTTIEAPNSYSVGVERINFPSNLKTFIWNNKDLDMEVMEFPEGVEIIKYVRRFK